LTVPSRTNLTIKEMSSSSPLANPSDLRQQADKILSVLKNLPVLEPKIRMRQHVEGIVESIKKKTLASQTSIRAQSDKHGPPCDPHKELGLTREFELEFTANLQPPCISLLV